MDRGRRVARGRRGCRSRRTANARGTGQARGAADHARQERQDWAFQKPSASAVPRSRRCRRTSAHCVNPIDAFLFAAMKAKGADAVATRRPPHADPSRLPRCARPAALAREVEAFVNDRSPDAWPKLVDRLLASPHYGERWARHWLDLVRYADSGGFEFDVDRREALALSRLRRPLVQQRQTLLAVRPRTDRGRRIRARRRRRDDRDRVPAPGARRRRRRRTRPAGCARGHRSRPRR